MLKYAIYAIYTTEIMVAIVNEISSDGHWFMFNKCRFLKVVRRFMAFKKNVKI